MGIHSEAKRRKLLEDRVGGEGSTAVTDEPQKIRDRLSSSGFECYADECITFHLVRDVDDMMNPKIEGFHPGFTHQQFGEEEKIYGYKDLQIHIWLHAVTFVTFVDITYSAKASGQRKVPVDLAAVLKEHFPAGFVTSRETFKTILRESASVAKFEKFLKEKATVVKSWSVGGQSGDAQSSDDGQSNTSTSCEIVKVDLADPLAQEWHARVQPFVRFFIDNGQPIDSKDPLWELYVMLERCKDNAQSASSSQLSVAGFCMLYRFYHYPDSSRLRISQVLVLPPFQGRGHGWQMLTTVNEIGLQRQCFDVTVEDPSDDLQVIRETVDVLRLLEDSRVVAGAKAAMAMDPIKTRETPASVAAEIPKTGGTGAAEPDGSNRDNHAQQGLNGYPAPQRNGSALSGSGGGGTEGEVGEGKGGDGEGGEGSVSEGRLRWGEPPSELVDSVRARLKISRKQFLRCWEILLYVLSVGMSEDGGRRKAWERLLKERLYNEEFGGRKNEQDAKEKKVVELDYVHDGMRMFFMTKLRTRPRDEANERGSDNGIRSNGALGSIGEDEEEAEGAGLQMPEMGGDGVIESRTPEERAAAVEAGLKDFTSERLEQIESIAQKVKRHCKGKFLT